MSFESLKSFLDSESDLTSYDFSDDDVVEAWENLIQRLTIKNLDDLRQFFKDELEDEKELKLNKEEFVYAIDSVIGNSKYSLQAISLFNEILHSDEDEITWKQFLEYYIEHGISEDVIDIQFPEAEIFTAPNVERETIIKIVSIEMDSSFCYIIISKYGKIGLYTGDFNLLQTYQAIFTRNDKFLTEKYKRIKSIWITDALFLSHVNILAICNTARNIILYDVQRQKHVPLWLIEGLPDTVYSLAFYYDSNVNLFMGDEFGSITIMTFINVKCGLLRRKYNDKVTHFYWRELRKETNFLQIETLKKIHSNAILSLIYYPEIYSLVSCSRDNKKSLVFFNLKEKKSTHKFQISQGVSCFSLNHQIHILITGSDNGVIQMWNLYVKSRAISVLKAHKSAIIDVKIIAFKNVAISCSRDGVLKVWELGNQNCLQQINLKFPCFDVLGKLIEWGTSTIYPGPKRLKNLQKEEIYSEDDDSKFIEKISQEKQYDETWQRSPILITCCNFIAKIKINEQEEKDNFLPAPSLLNEVIIPKDWKIEDKIEDKIEEVSVDINEPEDIINENVQIFDPILKDIPQTDFLKYMSDVEHDINYKIAISEKKKVDMIKTVSQCAPYLALDLYDVEEVELCLDLPVSNCKRTQQIAERTRRLLSAASTRSEILSSRSSKSRSSRSSIVEF